MLMLAGSNMMLCVAPFCVGSIFVTASRRETQAVFIGPYH